ncbi:YslB family protein [Carnobacterium pleistocenium]|uniref:YslB family protein n=1 Tax=Carnobacterium pleistocenium TaxID=181073 RepID=UPI001E3EBD1D|nr:YslB family protein [Carnobacterium pleistocenium]
MSRNKNEQQVDLEKFNDAPSLFGYELIRDILIPNLLGTDMHEILYWAGKELARQYPLQNRQDIILFFDKAGFGSIELSKDQRTKQVYTLSGEIVQARLEHVQPSFNLEAGFLAEQIQMQDNLYTEALTEVNIKTKIITFIVKSDTQDRLSIEEPLTHFILNDTKDKKNKFFEQGESILPSRSSKYER